MQIAFTGKINLIFSFSFIIVLLLIRNAVAFEWAILSFQHLWPENKRTTETVPLKS